MLGEDEKKLTAEYQEYQQKLDKQKEEYRKEHPDQVKEHTEFDDWFESDNQRELRQIFQGQSQMFDTMRELNRKLDEIVGKQERTLSLVSQGGYVQQQVQQQPGQPPVAVNVDTIRRHEVDALFNTQNQLAATANEMRYTKIVIMNFILRKHLKELKLGEFFYIEEKFQAIYHRSEEPRRHGNNQPSEATHGAGSVRGIRHPIPDIGDARRDKPRQAKLRTSTAKIGGEAELSDE